jgi:hypothetical protein
MQIHWYVEVSCGRVIQITDLHTVFLHYLHEAHLLEYPWTALLEERVSSLSREVDEAVRWIFIITVHLSISITFCVGHI